MVTVGQSDLPLSKNGGSYFPVNTSSYDHSVFNTGNSEESWLSVTSEGKLQTIPATPSQRVTYEGAVFTGKNLVKVHEPWTDRKLTDKERRGRRDFTMPAININE